MPKIEKFTHNSPLPDVNYWAKICENLIAYTETFLSSGEILSKKESGTSVDLKIVCINNYIEIHTITPNDLLGIQLANEIVNNIEIRLNKFLPGNLSIHRSKI